MSPAFFLAAGEVSGDMHGAALARALRERCPGLDLVGIGGARMAEAGVRLLADVTAHSAVGLTEQLPHVLPVARAYKNARRELAALRPDLVVLIDFQGANLALAKVARKLGLRTAYYIAPQDWLWSLPGGGPHKVAAAVDHVIAVFAREAEVYREAGARVTYVGHPLLDMVAPAPVEPRVASAPDEGWVAPAPDGGRVASVPGEGRVAPAPAGGQVALLPGSRTQEVARLLPAFLGAARRIVTVRPETRFVLPVASAGLAAAIAREVTASGLPIEVTAGGSPGPRGLPTVGSPGLVGARAALVASGTATLEAALAGVPCVAAYKVSPLTAFLARRFLRVRHVTLPNIVAGREVIPELLQERAEPNALAEALLPLLEEGPQRAAMLAGYADVRARLGEPGAVGRAADTLLADARLGNAASPLLL